MPRDPEQRSTPTEAIRPRWRQRTRPKGGPHAKDHALYEVWRAMKKRCTNANHPSYQGYGSRGIRVCERWMQSFAAFVEDMGQRPTDDHTLDRIDNDGDYTPFNCCWSTPEVQSRNRRNNRYVEANGERLTITDWAARLGIGKTTLLRRLAKGMDPVLAVTTPKTQFTQDHRMRRSS